MRAAVRGGGVHRGEVRERRHRVGLGLPGPAQCRSESDQVDRRDHAPKLRLPPAAKHYHGPGLRAGADHSSSDRVADEYNRSDRVTNENGSDRVTSKTRSDCIANYRSGRCHSVSSDNPDQRASRANADSGVRRRVVVESRRCRGHLRRLRGLRRAHNVRDALSETKGCGTATVREEGQPRGAE